MQSTLTIYQCMTKKPVTINIEDSISSAIETMEKKKVDHLPVIDNNGVLKGMVSKTDLYKLALKLSSMTTGPTYTSHSISHQKVSEVMTVEPISISPLDTLDRALEILIESKFHSLPVTENGHIVGIITSRDILRKMGHVGSIYGN